jgi:hypothetical protein
MNSQDENQEPEETHKQLRRRLSARAVVQIGIMHNQLVGETLTLKRYFERFAQLQSLGAPFSSATQRMAGLSPSELLEMANRITNLSGRLRTLIFILRACMRTSESDPDNMLEFFEEDLIYLERANKVYTDQS